MSCSLWRWTPECDGDFCIGDCDYCNKNMEDENEEETITIEASRIGEQPKGKATVLVPLSGGSNPPSLAKERRHNGVGKSNNTKANA